MRCFIAIELPEHVKARIFHEFEIIKNSGVVIGNFVEKNNLHLTLKFLGDVNEEQILQIKEKLSVIGSKFSAFEAETGEFGFFPSEEYIRVLWSEVRDKNNEIRNLNENIESSLNEIGFASENKEFTSHITTARIKLIKNKSIFFEKIKKIKKIKEKFKIKEFVLIKSELTRQGPVYKILEKFSLRE
ncbi:MAG: RNA 2',3'-cyclic phosphodiesterase [Nanoarchaeota archaeon]